MNSEMYSHLSKWLFYSILINYQFNLSDLKNLRRNEAVYGNINLAFGYFRVSTYVNVPIPSIKPSSNAYYPWTALPSNNLCDFYNFSLFFLYFFTKSINFSWLWVPKFLNVYLSCYWSGISGFKIVFNVLNIFKLFLLLALYSVMC